MTGRIKLLLGDQLVQTDSVPGVHPYEIDEPSIFDQGCGSFGLDPYQLPHKECPERFVCDVPSNIVNLAAFSECIEAMDCSMLVGMTTNVEAQSEMALFIHQMIPHHQNAVNMAVSTARTQWCMAFALLSPIETGSMLWSERLAVQKIGQGREKAHRVFGPPYQPHG